MFSSQDIREGEKAALICKVVKTKVLIGFYYTQKTTEDKVSPQFLEKCEIKMKNKILSKNNNAKKKSNAISKERLCLYQ